MNRILIATCLVGGITAAALAQTTYTFTATSGSWDSANNWSPSGTPIAGDTAIIPNGKTCLVNNANAAAKIIQVDSGGTLGVIGRTLSIGADSTVTTSTVNGLLYLDESGNVGTLNINGFPTISGSGAISARGADGYGAGVIRADDAQYDELTISSGVTCVGSISFVTDLCNYGTLRVDHANDTMSFGASFPVEQFEIGGGTLMVSAGLARFNYVKLSGSTTWEVSGGRLWVTDAAEEFSYLVAYRLKLSGGTLDMDNSFEFRTAFHFSGGTIEVAAGKTLAGTHP